MSKLQVQRFVFTGLTIIWMVIIFLFSAQTEDESTEQSLAVGMQVGGIVHRDFENWSKQAQIEFAQMYDKPIRKAAHMTEYAVLGAILTGTVLAWQGVCWKEFFGENFYWKKAGIIWLIAIIYAITDEIHQLFVPGRFGSPLDVAIDALGALAGIVVFRAIFQFKKVIGFYR